MSDNVLVLKREAFMHARRRGGRRRLTSSDDVEERHHLIVSVDRRRFGRALSIDGSWFRRFGRC